MKTALLILVIYLANIEGTDHKRGKEWKWVNGLNGWLKIHREPAEWEAADTICRNEEAQLASLWGSDFSAAMTTLNLAEDPSLTTLYTSGRITFGGMKTCTSHFISSTATLLYITGESMVSGSSDSGECCVLWFSNGTTATRSCKQQLPFICFAPAKLSCGENSGYELSNQTKRCYKFHPQVEHWSAARGVCQNNFGDLAVINSEEEAQFLIDLFKKYPKASGVNCNGERYCNEDRASIGFFYSRMIGQFLTFDGITVEKSGYSKWWNKSTFKHGYLSRDGTLTDWDGNAFTTPFICERKPFIQL